MAALAVSIKDHKTKVELNSLANLLLEATQKSIALEQQNSELRETLESSRRWGETITKYEVGELYKGRYAYKLRTPTTDMETKLRYCTHCFDSRKLSSLWEQGATFRFALPNAGRLERRNSENATLERKWRDASNGNYSRRG